MADEPAPCAYCGAVLPLAQLLRLDEAGGHVLLCQNCAFALPAETRAGAVPAERARGGTR